MKLINDAKNFIKKSPVIFFTVLLIVLFGLIFAGNKMRAPKIQPTQDQELKKDVSIFDFQENPRLSIQAKVDKENMVSLVAQKSGIVKHIYADNGQRVFAGNSIAYISDTIRGASSASVELEIAKETEEVYKDNLERQEKILKKQKEILNHTSTPEKNQERQIEIDKNKLKNEKENLELAGNLNELSIRRAQISTELARVSAPQNGTIEKIYVSAGQFVSAGTPIALFRSDSGNLLLEAKVSMDIASIISTEGYSLANIAGEEIKLKPVYISSEATDSYLYSVIFLLDGKYANYIADKSFVSIDILLDKTTSLDPFRPLLSLDALQITQEGAFAFVFDNGIARSRELELGKVYGQFVEIVSGLNKDDKVVLNRNVFDGDEVFIAK